MTLLRWEGWTRWPTEVSSNPYHSVILWNREWRGCCCSGAIWVQASLPWKAGGRHTAPRCFPMPAARGLPCPGMALPDLLQVSFGGACRAWRASRKEDRPPPPAFSPASGGTISVASLKGDAADFQWPVQNVYKMQTHFFCFASLPKIHIALDFRWIILDSRNVWAVNSLHYCICWFNKYNALFLMTFSCCSRSSLCRPPPSLVLPYKPALCCVSTF